MEGAWSPLWARHGLQTEIGKTFQNGLHLVKRVEWILASAPESFLFAFFFTRGSEPGGCSSSRSIRLSSALFLYVEYTRSRTIGQCRTYFCCFDSHTRKKKNNVMNFSILWLITNAGFSHMFEELCSELVKCLFGFFFSSFSIKRPFFPPTRFVAS